MRTALSLSIALVLLGSLVHSAAADEESDPAILLRQARVVDEVEKNVQKARALYARVWELAPQTPLGLRAGLRLSQLLQADAPVLDLLEDLTKRHTARMSDEQKQQVHDAIAARLPPGQNTMTPLGMLYMGIQDGAQAASTRSPVERKLTQVFKVHQVRTLPFRRNNSAAHRDLMRELEALGEPGRLALVRMVDEGEPDEAFAAAILLHKDDPSTAIRGYVRAMKLGRAEFRSRVIRAARFEKSADISPKVIAALLPLLEIAHIQDIHATVIARAAEHMSDEELVARSKDDPRRWVRYALSRGTPEAFAWTTAHASSKARPRWATDYLAQAVSNHRMEGQQPKYTVDLEPLGTRTLSGMFGLFLDELEARDASLNIFTWGRMGRVLAANDAWEPVRRSIWLRAFRTDDPKARQRLIAVNRASYQDGDPVGFPQDLFRSASDWDRLASLVPLHATQQAPWMKTSVSLWRAVIERMRKEDPEKLEALHEGIGQTLGTAVPESLRATCLAFLERRDHDKAATRAPEWIWEAAGATRDPAFLKHVEENLEKFRGYHAASKGLTAYHQSGGEGVVAFCKRVLAHPYGGLDHWAITALHRSEDPKAWTHLVSVAGHPRLRYSIALLLDADDPKQRALLVRYLEEAAAGAWDGERQSSGRDMLVHRAQKYRLREAVPFLIREYERQAPNQMKRSAVAVALDVIREYHERLAFFKSWGHDDDGTRRVLSMLDDEDAKIRRAAVMSVAALQGPRALPRLLQIAKNDKDEDVRQAALEAIERVATQTKTKTKEGKE